MSEFRLSERGLASSRYLALFDAQPSFVKDFALSPDDVSSPKARKTLLHGDEEIDVVIPLVNGEVRETLVETARNILGQIVELDSVAASSFNNSDEDGSLAVIEVLGASEAHFGYFGGHVNSQWSELFCRNASGAWAHHGVLKK